MRIFIGLSFVMLISQTRAMADPIWDPTEIARLSQQAGQLASNLSATIDTLRTFDKLSIQIGGAGARTASGQTGSGALARYSTLPASGGPTAADAAALITVVSPTGTQRSQTQRLWQAAFQQTAVDGLALSQIASQDAGEAVSRSKALAANASEAQDLRADMQANSDVALAVLSELVAIQSVLSLLLEQQSLGRLTSVANGGEGL